MSLQQLKLSIMAFPQGWDGANLTINVLLLPVGDPTAPLAPGAPPFAGTQLSLRAAMIPGLDDLPKPNAAGTVTRPITTTLPANALALFQALKDLPGPGNVVAKTTAKIDNVRIKKGLPQSYMDAFPFERSRTEFAIGGEEFGCSIRAKDPGKVTDPPPPPTTTWGQLLSFAIRQPRLAEALGMLYRFTLAPVPNPFVNGGWLYVSLDTSNPALPFVTQWTATPGLIKRYAARIPALGRRRSLFAAVLFPVVDPLPNAAAYLAPQIEAAQYDDGFAKILHCHQPVSTDAGVGDQNQVSPGTDAGIQIGWDDEQVVIWHNRSLDTARDRIGNVSTVAESPLGVAGYRVDVREAGAADWISLNLATGPISLGPFADVFTGEPPVEPMPVRSLAAADIEAWLPRYFAQWRGKSLVINDDTAYKLTGGGKPLPPSFLTAILPPDLHLLYGHDYEFQTRLSDLTGGGPAPDTKRENPAPAPIGKCPFRRNVPPKSVRIQTDPPAPNPAPDVRQINKIDVWRPLMGYPEFMFAGITDQSVIDNLIASIPAAQAAKSVLGTNDPDVEMLHIAVEVRRPLHDVLGPDDPGGAFELAYELERPFGPLPADPLASGPPLELMLSYEDNKHIDELKSRVLGDGDPLPIPRARDVRIRLTPMGHTRPHYFADERSRVGLTTDLVTRRDAVSEDDLYLPNSDANRLNAIFLQPVPGLEQRLAQQLHLEVTGLTFSGKPGSRTVFGASNALRHTLTGDHSSITFATQGDLLNHWIVAIMLDIDRDWTWDGLDDGGIEVSRDGVPVGTIVVRQTIDERSLKDSIPANPMKRDSTRLVFVDAVNPDQEGQTFPRELNPAWTVRAKFKGGAGGAGSTLTIPIRLPVASRPKQAIRIASAGIALSPYLSSDDYTSTDIRKRAVWLEFEEPIMDDKDAFFGRVLACAPDPLLFDGKIPDPVDPDLTIDPELIRVIVPGESRDESGIDAMRMLAKSTSSDRHYLMPLPPGMTENSPELFGFWTYELRMGHAFEWSTAQARFGRPLKVTGVQHPVPALSLTVNRTVRAITVAAPYARPVFNGAQLLDRRGPRTQIWVLLYANVVQADSQAHRNVLLFQRPAPAFTEPGTAPIRTNMGYATFDQKQIESVLKDLALPEATPLSVLAIELLPSGTNAPEDPVGADLGQQRIMRTSPLYAVSAIC